MTREHERAPGKGGAVDAQVGRAVAPGKRTLVAAAIGHAGPQPPTPQEDRTAALVDRGAGADPNRTGPQPFPAVGGSTGRQRHDAAEARFQLIESSVAAEDTTDDPATATEERSHDVAKDDAVRGRHTVRAQLTATGTRATAVAACTASATALATRGADVAGPVAAFETAVRAYQDAYERTYLVSTDAPVTRTAWRAETWRERLSDRTAALAAFRRWAGEPYIKFVVPAGRPNEVYVGTQDHGHVDIANDNALTAGIMRVDPTTMRVSELENASGGYRPGPLRNAIVLTRMIDLGFVQDDLAGTAVHHRADGSYTGSRIRT